MDKSELLHLLGWCSLIYIIVLFVWALFFIIGRNWIYNIHSKWFSISEEKFDIIHYSLIGLFKILLIVFFLIPYLVLRAI
ncbi:MAG: DUF6868 family protein [Gammaproteobacteria bacterium]